MKDDRLLEMRVFKTVVDAGSFTAAAHALGVSQPFVSQTVSSLERRLGVKLMHRSTRGRRLTEEGERFLLSCGRIIDEVEQAEAQISAAHSHVTGDLRVSAPLAFGLDQIVPRLPDFLAAHPDVKLRLALSDAITNLIEENVDVAIRMGLLQDSSLMSRKLCALQRIVVAAPSYLQVHGEPHAPQELVHHDCLMWQGPQEHLNRWPFIVDGTHQSVLIDGNFRSNNGQTLFHMCLAGVGIMRLAEHLAHPAIRQGALRPILSDYQARDDTAIHAVFLPERKLVPRIRSFIDYLIAVFHEPPWDR